MIVTRRTISNTVERDGLGLQFGNAVRVLFHPGESGINFRIGSTVVQAHPSNITETESCTRLGEISTIEHIMSALAGCEITDIDVELSAPEAPALDGSAKPWVEAILEGGIAEIGQRQLTGPFTRIYKHDEKRSEKIALALGNGHWKYVFRSETRFPFEQTYETEDVVADYIAEIAKARTFGWESDRELIEREGRAKGLREGGYVVLGADRPITELRYGDEPARHKLLDAIGDLYLAGVPIRYLNFVGEGSGHRLNIEAAAHLASVIRWDE